MTWRPLLALPARLLAPMLLAALALITAGLIYLEQVEEYTRTVVAQEHLRLTERMALEQTRLEAQSGQGNALQVHRLVTTLGLHQGLTHAWLVGADGRVVASLSRLEQGRPIDALLARQSTPLRQGVAAALRETSRAIHIQHLEAEAALLGHVAIHPDQKLILRVDLAQPLAARLYTGRGEILLEAGILLGFALLLGLLLHGLWFRRAAHLSATAAALGEGNLAARANLQGRDELAQVGTSLDTMAARIEAQHGQLRQLADLIGHSPVVAIVWRNEPDWPVAYVSDNLRRWGHAPEDFKSGALHYADLLHPEDRPRIDAELARHLTRGPDEYAQEYRLRHGDGHWLWIEDRTWLSRDAAGQISAIQGVLLDISERKRLETAQRQILSHLDTVANASPALFWTSGLDKGCDWFNQRWLEFTGRTMAQELGNGWAEGVHPDDFESCLATYVAAFDAREAFSMEYRLRRHDGEYRWLLDRGVPRYDADGQFLGFIGSCLDISEEKRIREALREQEVFFRLMAENIGDFIAVLDLEGRRLYNSPSYRRFFGEGRDLRGSDSFKEIHPDDLEFIRQVFQETVRTGIGQEASYRLITPDGVIHYMESRGSVITDDAGRPLRVVVVSRDVSERRLAEQALRDSEQRFRNLAENSADWIWALDLNGRHTYSNPNIFAILGYSPEEFLTLEPTSLLHPDDLASFGAIFAAARSSRSGWRNVVIRWRRKEGGYRLLESSAAPIIDAQGELQGFQGVDRDITERVQAEQERERLASILEATSDIVSMADPQGNLIYLNSPGRSLMGIAPEGTMPEVIAKVHPPWASDLILGIGVPTAIRDGVWSGETAVLGPAGQEIPVSQVILSHKNEQGQVLYLSTIMRDIRENRAAEQALRELNASLEARVAERTAELQILNQSLESFVYSVSHDLKTPLRGVEGYSRLLREDYASKLDDEGRLFIDNIRDGITRMNELIDDLLAYSRMERRRLEPGPINLNRLIDRLLDEHAANIAARGVTLSVNLPPLMVNADADGLTLVLRNLLENALKFTGQVAQPRIEIGTNQADDHVVLWIRDNGVGFDMKYHDRIFEIFQRLHRLEDYPGTGIGLALVKKAMQRMGGKVWAESAPGSGAAFYLWLKK